MKLKKHIITGVKIIAFLSIMDSVFSYNNENIQSFDFPYDEQKAGTYDKIELSKSAFTVLKKSIL